MASAGCGAWYCSNSARRYPAPSGASGSMPVAAYPSALSMGTKPPADPQPISRTRAGGGGSGVRTDGHSAVSQRSSGVMIHSLRAMPGPGAAANPSQPEPRRPGQTRGPATPPAITQPSLRRLGVQLEDGGPAAAADDHAADGVAAGQPVQVPVLELDHGLPG